MSVLCHEVVHGLSRRRRLMVEVAAQSKTSNAPATTAVKLKIDAMALQRVSGWVVHTVRKSEKVKKNPSLLLAVQKLEGEMQPNSNNHIFTSPQLQFTSLHAAGPQLMTYMQALEETCVQHMTRNSLFEVGPEMYRDTLSKLKGDPNLWEVFQLALRTAGLTDCRGENC